jgi:hypothetical protein
MKRVLVVTWSQSGQLTSIVERIVEPLRAAGHAVHVETLEPAKAFPFPWPLVDFIDAFPESVQLDPPPLAPLSAAVDGEFDLIFLAYQVWYLSPAMPMTAFLQSADARRLLAGKPVVTLVACRNMWLTAQQTMQRLITEAGGQLCDHIAFTDRGHPLATFITTPRWVLTGRRNAFLGLPPAGVSEADIEAASRFGRALADALNRDAEKASQPMLRGLRAVTVNPRLAVSEKAGNRAFRVWSKLIRAVGRRGKKRRWPMLALFAIYLVCMIATVVPLSLLVQFAFKPLLRGRLARLKEELEQPSGSEDFNIDRHVR